MADISFEEFSKAFGQRAAVQIFLAGVVLAMRDKLCSGEADCTRVLIALAGLLFALGVTDVLLTLYLPRLRFVVFRGIADGLLAGIVAGIVGGFLGFGRHPMTPTDYQDPQLYRVFRVLIFTVPTSALLGLCLGFLRPETPMNWRRDLSPAVALLLGVFLVTPWVLAIQIAKKDANGHGIEVGDIQVVFECFVVVYTALYAFSARWTLRQIGRATAVLAACIALAEAATRLARWHGDDSSDGSLYHLQFINAPSDTSGIWYFFVTGAVGLCATAMIFTAATWVSRPKPAAAAVNAPPADI